MLPSGSLLDLTGKAAIVAGGATLWQIIHPKIWYWPKMVGWVTLNMGGVTVLTLSMI